jgi:hypothetical protein
MRSEIGLVLFDPDGRPLSGASVGVLRRDGAAAIIWTAEDAGSPLGDETASDTYGRVEGWLDRGAYTLTISHPSITTFSIEWEAVIGRPLAMDQSWLAPDSATAAKIADDAVTEPKFANNAVGNSELAANAVDSTALASNSVGTTEIIDGAVSTAELASDVAFRAGNFGFPFTIDPVIGSEFVVASANMGRFARVHGNGSVSSLKFRVGTQSGNISVAVYSNSGTGRAALPGTRQRTSGSVACPAAGNASVSVGTALLVTDSDFWFAISVSSATATIAYAYNPSRMFTLLAHGFSCEGSSKHPLPDPAGTMATSGGKHVNQLPILVGV